MRKTLLLLLCGIICPIPFSSIIAENSASQSELPADEDNILTVRRGMIGEYTRDGQLIRQIVIPHPAPVGPSPADLVADEEGRAIVLNWDVFSSDHLSVFDPIAGSWQHHPITFWTNNLFNEDLSRLDEFVYTKEQRIRLDDFSTFDITIAGGLVGEISAGLDGRLYVLYWFGISPLPSVVRVVDAATLELERTIQLRDENGLIFPPGSFHYTAIAVNQYGTLFVATLEGRIYKFDPDGNYLAHLDVEAGRLLDIDVSGDGCLIAGTNDGEIVVTDTSFSSFIIFPANPGIGGGAWVAFGSIAGNSQPVADAAPDQQVECSGGGSGSAELQGGGSDADGDPLSCSWTSTDCLIDYPFACATTVSCPLGASTLALVVNDGQVDSEPDEVVVTVSDTIAPTLDVLLTPGALWPPNHRMADITASVTAADLCSESTVILDQILSDESDDAPGLGDGETVGDIQEAAYGTADFNFTLRAERAGTGDGRIYTVIYTAADESGNATSEAGFVVVPHDRGGVVEPIESALDDNGSGSVVIWAAVSGAHTYDVIRGDLSNIAETPVVINLATVTCIEDNSADLDTVGWEDPAVPDQGEGFFYLVEYFDGTSSSYGTESASKPRAPGAGDCD